MSHEWSRRISFDAAPLQHLRGDCEIPILMLDVSPGKQMEILRSVAQLLSQGRVFGILTRLYNPHHWPAADDPLSVYEFLVWHGYLPGPLDDPESTYTAVGTVQLEVATAGAATDIPIIALPRQLRPPPRSASHPEVAEAFTSALRGSCVAAQDHRPNSWVEVDLEEVRKRLRRDRRSSVLTQANSISTPQCPVGFGCLRSRRPAGRLSLSCLTTCGCLVCGEHGAGASFDEELGLGQYEA